MQNIASKSSKRKTNNTEQVKDGELKIDKIDPPDREWYLGKIRAGAIPVTSTVEFLSNLVEFGTGFLGCRQCWALAPEGRWRRIRRRSTDGIRKTEQEAVDADAGLNHHPLRSPTTMLIHPQRPAAGNHQSTSALHHATIAADPKPADHEGAEDD